MDSYTITTMLAILNALGAALNYSLYLKTAGQVVNRKPYAFSCVLHFIALLICFFYIGFLD